MANYTEHYQLHQWEPSDNFLRTDFNQDFARIDTGIRAAKAQAERLEREMALGNRYGSNGGESISGGLAVDGWPVFYQDINGPCTPAIQIQASGFAVTQDSRNRSYMNYSGTKYHYFAVK